MTDYYQKTVNDEALPIVRGNYADPSIVKVGNDYYMTHSSYEYMPGLIIWHSTDLIHWEAVGAALKEFNGIVWAPELVYEQGEFVIYFPANRMNWVTKTKDPRGDWSRPIPLEVNVIDPGHITDDHGTRYLHLAGGHVVELSDDGLKVEGELKKVYEHWIYPSDWIVEGCSPEGPKLVKKADYYYYTIALGGTSGPPTSHMIVSSRSKTPTGPWEHSPENPIIRTKSKDEKWWSKGHGTIFEGPDEQWYIVYHAYEENLHTIGRQTLISPITWTEDGWYRVDVANNEWKALDAPAESVEESADRFREGSLSLYWQWKRTVPLFRYWYEQSGPLKILGTADSGDYSPMLYMARHRYYTFEIEASVTGDAELQLLVFYDQDHYVGIGFSQDGIRVLRPYKQVGKKPVTVKNKIRLKIINHDHIVRFQYRDSEEAEWQNYDKVLDTSGLNHNTLGGFLSLRPGIEVTGKGSAKLYSYHYQGKSDV
ncbi:xylan 1,4-beta-xylosidase [Salipaludibacillus neizhouensis]|uniref:Xylan 1,4-beta-xylosidase n=1 Tax=Salipaludibacillus neizhouensis TaxID=885475 RepID=A0A3A9K544_9BACI|nr:family 43 glycosylhydrolase [Salipaludibacillus neizhouensis]RKL68174.1 xylan 1,4-beta-xylosidase [Salipaludibacillus neizhouensis]